MSVTCSALASHGIGAAQQRILQYHLPHALRSLTALLCSELMLRANPYRYKAQQQIHGRLLQCVTAGKLVAHLVTITLLTSLPLSFPPLFLSSRKHSANFPEQCVLLVERGLYKVESLASKSLWSNSDHYT